MKNLILSLILLFALSSSLFGQGSPPVASGDITAKLPFVGVLSSDHYTRGNTFAGPWTVECTVDGGTTFTYDTPTIVFKHDGIYWLTLDENPTIAGGKTYQIVTINIEHGGMDTWTGTYVLTAPVSAGITPEEIADEVWNQPRSEHTAAGSFGESNNAIPPTAAQNGAAVWNALRSAHTTAGSFGEGVLIVGPLPTGIITSSSLTDGLFTNAKFAANVFTASLFAGDVTTEFQTGLPTVPGIADGIWDELRAGHTTPGSFGEGVLSVINPVTAGTVTDKTGYSLLDPLTPQEVEDAVWNAEKDDHTGVGTFGEGTGSTAPLLVGVASGTAQAGGASTIRLAAGSEPTNGYYDDLLIQTTGGAGAGQAKWIRSYNGTTKDATVHSPWKVPVDNTTEYIIYPITFEFVKHIIAAGN